MGGCDIADHVWYSRNEVPENYGAMESWYLSEHGCSFGWREIKSSERRLFGLAVLVLVRELLMGNEFVPVGGSVRQKVFYYRGFAQISGVAKYDVPWQAKVAHWRLYSQQSRQCGVLHRSHSTICSLIAPLQIGHVIDSRTVALFSFRKSSPSAETSINWSKKSSEYRMKSCSVQTSLRKPGFWISNLPRLIEMLSWFGWDNLRSRIKRVWTL